MASSRTTSGPNNEYGQFYQLQNISGQVLNTQQSMFGEHVMDGMAGSSSIMTPSQTSPSSPGDSSPFSSNLNPEGRVSKPARRRSRASRRTPTTLVNTDPSNFRAMVQQFTGGPAAAYTAEPRYQMPGEGNISFGFAGLNQQRLDVQQQQQRQPHQHQQLQFQHNMFNSINRNHDHSLP
ncbi:hypothetical protein LIER_12286 [Lithospermum erythrorhizon]|uniref:VQ domain-containing protein n=1 Tax=Lithospermum erythrorhizon TaxID=34254 RepID=A0AAV3PR88_LITER